MSHMKQWSFESNIISYSKYYHIKILYHNSRFEKNEFLYDAWIHVHIKKIFDIEEGYFTCINEGMKLINIMAL